MFKSMRFHATNAVVLHKVLLSRYHAWFNSINQCRPGRSDLLQTLRFSEVAGGDARPTSRALARPDVAPGKSSRTSHRRKRDVRRMKVFDALSVH